MANGGDDQRGEEAAGRSLSDNARIGAGIGLLAALALFIVQNLEGADVTFLWFNLNLPLAAALLLSAAAGGLVVWIFTTFRGRSARKRQEAMYESAIRDAKK